MRVTLRKFKSDGIRHDSQFLLFPSYFIMSILVRGTLILVCLEKLGDD